ncbi:MAG: hypothetical protein NC212_09125 [Staphylococcus sp.]|nr:hypothetical protein [Staphylococcus sp.]
MKATRLLMLGNSIASIALLASCSHLSGDAKKIVGTYYNTEISQTEPVMVLKKDGTCVIRAIKPGVLTYSVEGEWNVENDSLIINTKPSSLTFEGDSTLIGHIPERLAQKLIGHTDFTLQLGHDGISYLYQRRNE